MFDVIIIGGGAAGFFTAIQIVEQNSSLKVAILERGKTVLAKVKVSGGGRCNVTHAEFNPADLVLNYPRGEKELLGPFHSFCTGDTMAFFEERGVPLKIEEDGRIFPQSDSSQSIIDCFINETERLGIKVMKLCPVSNIAYENKNKPELGFLVTTPKKEFKAKKVVVATGSNPKIWNLLEGLGHKIVPPVPSLFTFNIKDSRITGIPGVSTTARVTVYESKKGKTKVSSKIKTTVSKKPLLEAEGPLLITHWGMSGPAILKLSAWGATLLHAKNYQFVVQVNWLPDMVPGAVLEYLNSVKETDPKKTILRTKILDIPRRLWVNLVKAADIDETVKWATATKVQLQNLADQLTESEFSVNGKSTFKEEFVTAGGIDLKEVNFKTYESKVVKNLFFAGEVINVDAITGGFNFQNAWTGGFIAAQTIAKL
ncbi:NAD(P)/FAD-dependent oxidoreductase [Cellulophaga lytica]|nr:NAD(P)/FAD-dependent oxidoreductase [Cellulophaga lytica]